ncbi:DNA recombination protein RmuC [Ferrovibrio sp.]|uniref:DNA recombination protein RmuC n=1 Tax=Ferrovibrio sp. TaxID=1917215 RepID=UPI00262F55AE|nr:DNA recombination protein RmuC [Ferrovibrio sp.]
MSILGIASIAGLAIILILLVVLLRRGAGAGDQAALVAELRDQVDQARDEAASAQAARLEAERQAAGLRSELAVKTQAFEKLAETATQAARAAAVESAAQLSNKLLADHKREAEAQKEEGEKRVKQVTEGLAQQFLTVTETVTRLHQQVGDSRKSIDTVYRALSHPGGAGRLAEIGLENVLKAFGLQPGLDFIIQYHAAGDGERGNLRPDAVVFLPGDAVLVIDSKASKLLLDHAEAEDEVAEAAALAQLAQRMALHLRALSAKDYGNAVLATYRELKRGGSLKRSMIAMMLPNDAAVEKLRRADPDFERRAAEVDIVVTGPSALAAIIAVSRLQIDGGRQIENSEKIMEVVGQLIESTATALTLADRVGRGLQQATEQFEAFSRSVNARLLPRIRKLTQLGIRSPKAPAALPSFQVSVQRADVIEADAEDVTPQLPGLNDGTGK